MDIRVEMTQLKEIAGFLSNVKNTLENIETVISAINKGMDGDWSGQGRDAFREIWFSRVKEINKCKVTVENSRTALLGAVMVYERTEGTININIGNLSADNIF